MGSAFTKTVFGATFKVVTVVGFPLAELSKLRVSTRFDNLHGIFQAEKRIGYIAINTIQDALIFRSLLLDMVLFDRDFFTYKLVFYLSVKGNIFWRNFADEGFAGASYNRRATLICNIHMLFYEIFVILRRPTSSEDCNTFHHTVFTIEAAANLYKSKSGRCFDIEYLSRFAKTIPFGHFFTLPKFYRDTVNLPEGLTFEELLFWIGMNPLHKRHANKHILLVADEHLIDTGDGKRNTLNLTIRPEFLVHRGASGGVFRDASNNPDRYDFDDFVVFNDILPFMD